MLVNRYDPVVAECKAYELESNVTVKEQKCSSASECGAMPRNCTFVVLGLELPRTFCAVPIFSSLFFCNRSCPRTARQSSMSHNIVICLPVRVRMLLVCLVGHIPSPQVT